MGPDPVFDLGREERGAWSRQDFTHPQHGTRVNIERAFLGPLAASLAVRKLGEKTCSLHALDRVRLDDKGPPRTDLFDHIHCQVFLTELQSALHTFQHLGNLVVDDSFRKIERLQRFHQTSHVHHIHSGQQACHRGQPSLVTRLGIVDF